MKYLCFVDFQGIRIVSLAVTLGAILVSRQLTGAAVVVVVIPVVGVIMQW